jgi:predicted PurR-regulated permease PerM
VRRSYVTNALLILVAAAIGYLCLLMAAPFIIAIAWAGVLAIIINPIYDWLRARLKSRNLAAALACTTAVLVVVLPIVGVSIAVTRSVIELLDLQNATDGQGPGSVSEWMTHEADVVTQWLTAHLGIDPASVNVATVLQQVANASWNQTRSLVGGVLGFFVNLVIVIFTLFFFLRDQDDVLRVIRSFLPLSSENASAVFRRVHDVIRASVMGGGAVALSQGILAGLGFWALGIPSPLLWGVATLFFSFIPLVGAAGIWVPAAIFLLIKGSWIKAIVLGSYGVLVISLVDNFLRPVLIGDATRLHTLLIFFSILGGIQVFGFLGLVMGPVVLAVGLALVEIFRREIVETEDEERRRAPAAAPEPADAPPLRRS